MPNNFEHDNIEHIKHKSVYHVGNKVYMSTTFNSAHKTNDRNMFYPKAIY